MSKLKKLFKLITASLHPERCPYCHRVIKEDNYACKKCKKSFPQFGIFQGVKGGYKCSSVFPYKGKYKRAVLSFKFRRKTRYAPQLAVVLSSNIKRNYENMVFDLITYVPMHKKPLRKRGYNQSELLAKELSKIMGIPCVGLLEKTKNTKPQCNLSAKERRNNLKGVFKLTDKKRVSGRCILIIDDIVTTGTTLGECASALQKGNPAHICCATILATANLY